MKKILYVITTMHHKRVFESFKPDPDFEQILLGPVPKVTTNLVPEDYRDMGIKVITFNNTKDIQAIVNKIKPDIYVRSGIDFLHNMHLPKSCKRVLIDHGMKPIYVSKTTKRGKLSTWENIDMYCGEGQSFKDMLKSGLINYDDDKVVLNALPQFDLLHDADYYNKYKQKILEGLNAKWAKKIVLFFGFCGKDREDFTYHNEDFFKASVELEKIAKKHNWLILMKPRRSNEKIFEFLKRQKWKDTYWSDYTKILKSKNVHFISTNTHVYRYFFADMIVMNGCSTVEVEACIENKPLFIIRTHPLVKNSIYYDSFGAIQHNAAHVIVNTDDIESCLLNNKKYHNKTNQQNFLTNIDVKNDGMSYKRVIKAIKNI